MPLVSVISKEEICKQHGMIGMLMIKCKSCKLFERKEAERSWIYTVSNPIHPKYDTMVAISKYGKKYAMLTPEDLTEEEMIVFAYVLDDAEPDEEIVVFTQRDYDAVKKYLRDKKNKVTLCS